MQTKAINNNIQLKYKNYQYSPIVSFKAKYADSTIKCNAYSDFRKGEAREMTALVLGDECVSPLKIKGLDSGFDSYVHIYGLGNLHLMLMPNTDNINNFVQNIDKKREATIETINELTRVVNKTNPQDSLYLFESGSSEIQALNNTKGIIPAHLHYILGDDIPTDEIFTLFEKKSERNLTILKNITIDDLSDFIRMRTLNGKIGYKHISKQKNGNRIDSAVLIEDNPFIPSKSQLQPKVFSILMYNSDNPQYYDWKTIDNLPTNWSEIVKKRICSNRINNKAFLEKLKRLHFT